ncbi:hypothetical protein L596_024638 [Steinernema carpocapsae]|uniref:Uncharacterized protein n=1 Tax=Steinernema carpocapsae TaxID=34508 RepID=A0A4U5M5B0_STECR|nr:hypothetical protein L596_024638 [Steinernema carpocapsae]
MFQVLILCVFAAVTTVYFTLGCAKKKPKKQAEPSPKVQKSMVAQSKMATSKQCNIQSGLGKDDPDLMSFKPDEDTPKKDAPGETVAQSLKTAASQESQEEPDEVTGEDDDEKTKTVNSIAPQTDLRSIVLENNLKEAQEAKEAREKAEAEKANKNADQNEADVAPEKAKSAKQKAGVSPANKTVEVTKTMVMVNRGRMTAASPVPTKTSVTSPGGAKTQQSAPADKTQMTIMPETVASKKESKREGVTQDEESKRRKKQKQSKVKPKKVSKASAKDKSIDTQSDVHTTQSASEKRTKADENAALLQKTQYTTAPK